MFLLYLSEKTFSWMMLTKEMLYFSYGSKIKALCLMVSLTFYTKNCTVDKKKKQLHWDRVKIVVNKLQLQKAVLVKIK